MMKKLTTAIYAGILGIFISSIAFGAGFYPYQPPTAGYPTSPTFTHVGSQSWTATDNASGNGTGDLKNWRDAYVNRNIIGNGGRISGYTFGAAGHTDNGAFMTIVMKDNNVRLGNAGNSSMTGKYNFLAGDGAGAGLTSAGSAAGANIAIGKDALKSATTGAFHIAIGDNAAAAVTTNSHTVAIGFQVLSKSTAQENVGVGSVALRNNTTGQYNAAFGNDSMTGNTTGSGNSAFGQWSLFAKQTGDENSAFGESALFQQTGATGNSGFGFTTLGSILTGNYNTALGHSAGRVIKYGDRNTFLGQSSGMTTGHDNANYVTVIGSGVEAACDYACTVIGADDTDGTGVPATKVGIGFNAPRYPLDVIGNANITGSVGIGGDRVTSMVGYGGAKLAVAGPFSVLDNNSVFWGTNPNTKIVYDSGTGYFTQQAFGGHYFNSYDGGYVTQFTIGDNGTLTARSLTGTGSRTVVASATGVLSAPTSDARAKENIHPLTDNLDVIALLKDPAIHAVYYSWKDKTRGAGPEIGFTAQMFEHSVPEITGTDGRGSLYLDYPKIAAILWEQNRALLKRIEALEANKK